MRYYIILASALLVLNSCKEATKSEPNTPISEPVAVKTFPADISKVFQAHGGIDSWNAFGGLTFEIQEEDGNDLYQVDLKSRRSLITYKDHLLGFDGETVWLKDRDTTAFSGNPRFLYNLLFYFYAMPFILADDGINYAPADTLSFDGVDYPGIAISYDAGVGESPDDEYMLYYHPETHDMAWLAYTVTYFSKEKSKDFRFIRYGEWETVSGLKLPKTLTWYVVEDGQPVTERSSMHIASSSLSESAPEAGLFELPEGAQTID